MGYYKRLLTEEQEDHRLELRDVRAAIDDSVDRGDAREERSHLLTREAELSKSE
jgi:hypothetical protein